MQGKYIHVIYWSNEKATPPANIEIETPFAKQTQHNNHNERTTSSLHHHSRTHIVLDIRVGAVCEQQSHALGAARLGGHDERSGAVLAMRARVWARQIETKNTSG